MGQIERVVGGDDGAAASVAMGGDLFGDGFG